jgi:hypothetical protein
MHKPRTLTLLIAAVFGLAVVTVALAATLVLDSDGNSPERPSSNTAAVTTPTRAPSPTATVATDRPAEIPQDVWDKLLALPQKLRDDLLSRFEAGGIGVSDIETVINEYENRDQGVRVGTVLEATDSMLQLEVYTTGERASVVINDKTVLKRGHDDITPADLQPDELVMVVSMDGGVTAFSVTAFGVGAP